MMNARTNSLRDGQPDSSWPERLSNSLGLRSSADVGPARETIAPLEQAKRLAAALLSERGEASGAVVARELHQVIIPAFGRSDSVLKAGAGVIHF